MFLKVTKILSYFLIFSLIEEFQCKTQYNPPWGNLLYEETTKKPSQSDIKFNLYTRQAPKATPVDTNALLKKSSFDKKKFTKIVTHGFQSSGDSDTCQTIKDYYLTYQDVNVVIVDWKSIAGNLNYLIPSSSTKSVGQAVANFVDMLTDYGADPMNIHLIGHSLGAHVMGFAGNSTKETISRITGLDPAYPSFGFLQLAGGRLSKGQAVFVDVIHTSGGTFGLMNPIGDVDFYPNGGTMYQPGCNELNEIPAACSHGRSWQLFRESINPDTIYPSQKCQDYNQFINDHSKCDDEIVYMGEYVATDAYGSYFLLTGAKENYQIV